jgi:hypothetical protein
MGPVLGDPAIRFPPAEGMAMAATTANTTIASPTQRRLIGQLYGLGRPASDAADQLPAVGSAVRDGEVPCPDDGDDEPGARVVAGTGGDAAVVAPLGAGVAAVVGA